MANYAVFEFRMKGKFEDRTEVLKLFKQEYKIRFAISDVHDYIHEEDEETTIVYGDCKWSVYNCLIEGRNFPNYKLKDKISEFESVDCCCDNINFVDVSSVAKVYSLEIQIASEERGCMFMEFYHIDAEGNILVDECLEPEGLPDYGDEVPDDKWDEYYEAEDACYQKVNDYFTI